MKKLIIGEKILEAERIVKTEKEIIGYNGESKVFAFRSVNDFSKFSLDNGQEYDVDDKEVLQNRIDDLELFILMREGLI